MVTGVEDITQLIAGISRASAQETESISQITTGVDLISTVVQTNSSTSEGSAAANEELSGQADMMKLLVFKFNVE